jgi:hypothetical protein
MPDSKSTIVNGQLSVVHRLAGMNLPPVTEKKPLHMQLTKIRATFIIWRSWLCQRKLYFKIWIGFLFYEIHLLI